MRHRCVYSPLVESYEASKIKPLIIKRDGGMGGPTLASPSSISFLKPTVLEERSVSDLVQEESSYGDGSEKGGVRDDNSPAPQDPVAASHGDSSLLATGSGRCRQIRPHSVLSVCCFTALLLPFFSMLLPLDNSVLDLLTVSLGPGDEQILAATSTHDEAPGISPKRCL